MTDENRSNPPSSSRWNASRRRMPTPASRRGTVTDAQKAAIAEARNFYDAKMAEQEVLHQSKMRDDHSTRPSARPSADGDTAAIASG